MTDLPEHLRPTGSERGFAHMPAIPSEYGGEVLAYESSAASDPHVWLRLRCPADLNDPLGKWLEAVAHLTAENAWKLGEQLMTLVENHYQGDSRPPHEDDTEGLTFVRRPRDEDDE